MSILKVTVYDPYHNRILDKKYTYVEEEKQLRIRKRTSIVNDMLVDRFLWMNWKWKLPVDMHAACYYLMFEIPKSWNIIDELPLIICIDEDKN